MFLLGNAIRLNAWLALVRSFAAGLIGVRGKLARAHGL